MPELTPEGQHQRNPEELPDLMKFELVENENLRDPGPLKIILLEDVEGQLLMHFLLVVCSSTFFSSNCNFFKFLLVLLRSTYRNLQEVVSFHWTHLVLVLMRPFF